jgi:hypothetical protein
MGLLDDLKQQADSLRQKQQVTQEEISQNLLAAHAKLNDALHYWIELFNSLNVIKPEIARFYYIESGASKLENLMQSDYNVNGRRLTLDHKDYIEAVVLRFRCAANHKVTIEKEADPLVQRMRENLWMYNLKFDVKEVRNSRGYVERGIFTILAEVAVQVTVSADLEKAQIKIVTKNLEKFGEYTYTYDFDEFGKAIHEELAKVIVGQPNTFRTLGRHQASMSVRTSATRSSSRLETPEGVTAAPTVPESSDDPNRSFIGNIKSILKR